MTEPDLSLAPLERSPTLTEKVTDAIVQAVMERRIPFGSRLVEAELSRALNVSRVPIREALRLLESQGVVVNTPYKGMCLMTVDERKLDEIQATLLQPLPNTPQPVGMPPPGWGNLGPGAKVGTGWTGG